MPDSPSLPTRPRRSAMDGAVSEWTGPGTRTRPRTLQAAYAVVLVVLLATPLAPWAPRVLGQTTTTWVQHASEAFLLAGALPLYWEWLATARTPAGIVPRSSTTTPTVHSRRVAWYAILVAVLVLLEGPLVETVVGRRLPQSVITVRDAWVGIIALSVYYDWSRRLWPETPAVGTLRPRSSRASVLVAVAAVNLAIFWAPVRELLGPSLFSTLDFHAEAFSATLLLPLYTEAVLPATGGDAALVVAPSGRRRRRTWPLWAWVGACAVAVGLAQGGAGDLFPNAFGTWWVRSSEAPLAALFISAYVELTRRWTPSGPS